ncbi:MAG: hypothetical protein J7L07_01315 [Candidatus Odinarchaeota archaeon]|nr:hypothetical protein [Candidatus Odinarchaeota archaeon]
MNFRSLVCIFLIISVFFAVSLNSEIAESQETLFTILEDHVYIILNETNHAIVLENIKLNVTGRLNSIAFRIYAESISNLAIFENDVEQNYTLIEGETYWSLIIQYSEDLEEGVMKNLTIIYTTDAYTSVTEDNFVIFDYPYFASADIDLLQIRIRLPKNSRISDEKFSIFPKPSKNWTDGTYFYFDWNFYSIERKTSFVVHLKYFVEESSQIITPPETEGDTYLRSFLLGIPIGLGAVLLIYLGVQFLLRRTVKPEVEFDIGVFLSENEKKVLKSILDRKGKCWQSEIVMDTKLSKTAVSLALVSLEKKGLITRERMGRENLIRTTEKLSKIVEMMES